jgi:CRP/FNR family transcriptional regulator, anaerobic regulatory protein
MPAPLHGASDCLPVQELVRLLGGDPATLIDAEAHALAPARRIEEGAALVHEGMAAHSLHVVRSGSFKCVKTLEDGYEQVMGFALAGDLLGFDALHSGCQPATVVALEVSTVYALPLAGLQDLRRRCPALDGALQRALSQQLVHAAELTEMLTAVSADVRLARFLICMAARAAEIGWSARRLRLRMCRRDIASLLGVAHETVSRSFTSMADAGLLKVDNREVEILDLQRLKQRARCTRGAVDTPPPGHAGALRANGASHLAMAWCSSILPDQAAPV